MTRIDFYQVTGDERMFTCRLIDMVYRRGHLVYVHTLDAGQAGALDDYLWVFREDAFVPHALQSQKLDVPIKIGFGDGLDDHQDVMINLSGSVPSFFSRFDRVAEVAPANENDRGATRRNYVYYKSRGYALNYHEIS